MSENHKKELCQSTPLSNTRQKQTSRHPTQDHLKLSNSTSSKKQRHKSNDDARKNKEKKNESPELEITRPFNVEHKGFYFTNIIDFLSYC
jgi:hypothetical protein